MNYGFLWDEARQTILDEIYLVYFESGRSYTGDDMFMIHCHGSSAILQRLSEILGLLTLVLLNLVNLLVERFSMDGLA